MPHGHTPFRHFRISASIPDLRDSFALAWRVSAFGSQAEAEEPHHTLASVRKVHADNGRDDSSPVCPENKNGTKWDTLGRKCKNLSPSEIRTRLAATKSHPGESNQERNGAQWETMGMNEKNSVPSFPGKRSGSLGRFYRASEFVGSPFMVSLSNHGRTAHWKVLGQWG